MNPAYWLFLVVFAANISSALFLYAVFWFWAEHDTRARNRRFRGRLQKLFARDAERERKHLGEFRGIAQWLPEDEPTFAARRP